MRMVPVMGARYLQVSAEVFGHAFEGARLHTMIAEATSPFEASDGARYFLAGDDQSGFVIRADGDLTNVWSVERGRGDEIVRDALRNGAETLDCFDGYLPTLYARHGFVEYAREANWTPGGPDVVFMATPERLARKATD